MREDVTALSKMHGSCALASQLMPAVATAAAAPADLAGLLARPGFSGFPAVLTTDYLCCRVKMEKEKQQNKNNADDPQQPATPSAVAGGEQPGSGDGGGDDGGGNSRLLNNLPAFLMDYYGSKHNAPSGMVPLHWQEGREEMDELVTEALELANKALGIRKSEVAASASKAAASTSEAAASTSEAAAADDAPADASGSSGIGLARTAVDQMRAQGLATAEAAKFEEYTTVCNNPDCGKRPEPGQRFPQCGHCKAAYCSRDCQVADWRQHKLVCRPEKLRQHVPEEREALLSIKRASAAQLAETLMGELALAGTAWRERLGRGIVVVYMSNLAYLMSPSSEAKDKCQLYAFYFPERDYPARVPQIPGLQEQFKSMGGKSVFKRFGDEHVPVIIMDQLFAMSMGLPRIPTIGACRQVLKHASTEVRHMDVICWDSVSGDMLLVDFHSMVTVVSEVPRCALRLCCLPLCCP
ncbi:hypothetical protein COHA_003577 [Chlorella ohadii]|uniref:MYND-type domain-containing protein n=1 Tax=Chlorella ohadii TaxID=2649997 RepID=A0AAD5DTE5_9CHLO|nr:hypothetical protein COHA_003577 [Chlorella ohadii]